MRFRPALVVTSILGFLTFVFSIGAFTLWLSDYRSAALKCCNPSTASCASARERLVWVVAGSGASAWPTISAACLFMMFTVLMCMQSYDHGKFIKRMFGFTNASPGMATTVKSLLVAAAGLILVLLAYALGNTSRPLQGLWASAGCGTVTFPTAGRDWAFAALLCWCGSCFSGHYISVKQRVEGVLELRTSGAYKFMLWFVIGLLIIAPIFATFYFGHDVRDNHGYTDAIASCCTGASTTECAGAKAQLRASLIDDNLSARKTSFGAMVVSWLLLGGFVLMLYYAGRELRVNGGLPHRTWRHVYAASALVVAIVIVLLTHAWGATGGKSAHALWAAAQCPGSLPTQSGLLLVALISVLTAALLGHALVSPWRQTDATPVRAPLMSGA